MANIIQMTDAQGHNVFPTYVPRCEMQTYDVYTEDELSNALNKAFAYNGKWIEIVHLGVRTSGLSLDGGTYMLFTHTANEDYGEQFLMGYGDGKVKFRTKFNGSFTPWKELQMS